MIPEWIRLLRTVAVIPVSTAENERKFSALKLNFTHLRERLSGDRLAEKMDIKAIECVDVKRACTAGNI